MGIALDAAVKLPNTTSILSLLRFPFFDVQPTSSLQLRNISMNIDCATFSKLRQDVCALMPDFNFEVSDMLRLNIAAITTREMSQS